MQVRDPFRTAMLIPSMMDYKEPKLIRKYINYMFVVRLLLTVVSMISSTGIAFFIRCYSRIL